MNTQDFDKGFHNGMFIGIFIAIVISIIVWKRLKKTKKPYYDERQELIRGRAYKNGFYAMIIWIGISMFAEFLFDRTIFDRGSFAIITVLVGIGVNVVYSILHDSYFYVNMNRKKYILLLIIVTLINLASSIVMIISGGIVVDGVVTYKATNIFVTIFLAVVLLAVYIREKIEKLLEKKDEE